MENKLKELKDLVFFGKIKEVEKILYKCKINELKEINTIQKREIKEKIKDNENFEKFLNTNPEEQYKLFILQKLAANELETNTEIRLNKLILEVLRIKLKS